MQLEKIQIWPDRDEVVLTAYIQDDSPDLSNGRNRPAIVVLPGGAYLFTSDREAEPVAVRFAGFGYHTFVLRYSVFIKPSDQPPEWSEGAFDPSKGNPRAAYPGPLLDLARAMAVIRENAARWQVDPDKIAVCGFSAGGHLAASLGVHWQDEFLKESLGADNETFRPAAMILCYPLIDFPDIKEESRLFQKIDIAHKDLLNATSLAVFRTLEPSDDALAKASPVFYVNSLTPPAFIWHTAADRLVPVAGSLNFAAAMTEHGIPCELHVFEDGPHGLALADDTTATTPDQIDQPVRIWIDLARIWLSRHLPVLQPENE